MKILILLAFMSLTSFSNAENELALQLNKSNTKSISSSRPIKLTFIIIQEYSMGNGCTYFLHGTVTMTWDPERPKKKPTITSMDLTITTSGDCMNSVDGQNIYIEDFGWDEESEKFTDIHFKLTGNSTTDEILLSSPFRSDFVAQLNAQL